MKRSLLFAICIALTVFPACKKFLHYFTVEQGATDSTCKIFAQTGFTPGDTITGSYGGGFSISYNEAGKPAAVRLSIFSENEGIDSFFYEMTYSTSDTNLVRVKTGADEFSVWLDPVTRTVTQVFNTFYYYDEQGRLERRITGEGGVTTLSNEYDSLGNVISLTLKHHNGVSVSHTYEYDYTRTSGGPYSTVGLIEDHWLNLFEVLNWIPLQPKHLRISHSITTQNGPDTEDVTLNFSNHHVDGSGFLRSFDVSDGFSTYTVINHWDCTAK